jgi:peptide deformylase
MRAVDSQIDFPPPPPYFCSMSLRPILIIPDSRLRQVSKRVAAVDDGVRSLMDDMLDTMYDAPGIGLAAPQVASDIRVIVLDVAKRKDKTAERDPICLANPEVLWTSEERSVYDEGCLSIPDFYEEVERPARVRVGFLDRDGASCEIAAEGILATCLQHEIDHLNGILFIDHISRLKRARVIKKFEKVARFQEPVLIKRDRAASDAR